MQRPTYALAIAILSLLFGSGCTSRVDIRASVLRMDREGVLVRVESEPGMEVNASGVEAIVGPEGTVEILIPLDEFTDPTFAHLTIDASSESFLGLSSSHGHVNIDLPMQPRLAAALPARGSGPFLMLAGQGHHVASEFEHFGAKATGQFGEFYLSVDENGRASLPLRANPDAHVVLADVGVDIDATGSGTWEMPLNVLLGRLPNSELTSQEPTLVLPVEIEDHGRTLAGEIRLELRQLRDALLALAAHSAPMFPSDDADSSVEAILYVGYGGPFWIGGDGPLASADRIAIGRAQPPREGPPCTGYGTNLILGGNESIPRQYVDVEITVENSSNGAEVHRETAPGGGEGCPTSISHRDTIQDGPGRDALYRIAQRLL